MQESTYSSLSDPFFENLRGRDLPKDEAFHQNVKSYRLFIKSLELQEKARKTDTERTNAQVQQIQAELDELQAIHDRNSQELGTLKFKADEKRTLKQLAQNKFENPVETFINDLPVYVTLNKKASQLDEDHRFLREQLEQLEDDISSITQEVARRKKVADELHEVVGEYRERMENPEASPREDEQMHQIDEDFNENSDEYDPMELSV